MAKGRKTGGGSRKGVPNKVTREAREVFTEFVQRNALQAQKLWERVSKKDPARALELLAKLAEFALPKLARTEVTGPNGGAWEVKSTIEFVDAGRPSGANHDAPGAPPGE